MERSDFLRSLIDLDGTGLEIGPSYNPLVPKSAGYRIETADYTDACELRAKYQDARNVDISRIEEVDHVVKKKSLAQTVGKRNHYDYIVASHVIEHTPDMLRFLKDCELMLKPAGILLLAVPDKRCCFDVFQPLTSTGGVLQAHFDRHTKPALGTIFDDRAYNAIRAGAIGWPIASDGALSFFLELPTALSTFAADRKRKSYIDVHVWKFVPSSFRLIVNDLYALGEMRLRENQFFDSVGNEFYVTLSGTGAGCSETRLNLARRTLAEHAQILLESSWQAGGGGGS